MGNYSYLSQQSEEHFAAHNRNDLEFIELNPLPFCLICFPIEEQFIENPFETEEESYQTVPIFDIFLSESEHSTQTVTPEPMTQDPMQPNILAVLQGIQTALGQKNNTPLPLFRGNTQDPIEWLDDFERAATANQYNNEYKFQIVGGYLHGSPAIWFSQETDANTHQRIIKWMPANAKENNTSFTTWFENKFRTPILISKWHMELEKRTQDSGEIVTEYAKAIRKLIKHVNSGRN
ncbi:hypothetical protein G9A89_019789 [Geosiphon pyriformis]|nr:hypothetical protein G9A89_019789 [Geosiphon pyriformis]